MVKFNEEANMNWLEQWKGGDQHVFWVVEEDKTCEYSIIFYYNVMFICSPMSNFLPYQMFRKFLDAES